MVTKRFKNNSYYKGITLHRESLSYRPDIVGTLHAFLQEPNAVGSLEASFEGSNILESLHASFEGPYVVEFLHASFEQPNMVGNYLNLVNLKNHKNVILQVFYKSKMCNIGYRINRKDILFQNNPLRNPYNTTSKFDRRHIKIDFSG